MSSSSVAQNWSTYSFIHLVMCNQSAAKEADDLVYMNSKLHILSQKEVDYKQRAT